MKKFTMTVLMFLLAFTSLSYAESIGVTPPANISLYEQPDAKSKVLETIGPGTAMIPILSQGNWLKVADPANGQVGWINNETLPVQNRVYVKTITKNINTPGSNGSQIIQYSGTEQLDDKQMRQLMQNLENRQAELQQVFDQLLNQSVSNLNVLLRQLNRQTSQPWVSPGQTVIIAPAAKTTTPAVPAPPIAPQANTTAPSVATPKLEPGNATSVPQAS